MSERIQRFKVGDEVVVAAHAPMLEPGTHLIVYSVTEDVRPDFLTGGKPLTAGYYLHRPEAPRDRSVPLHLLWDWMLDPVEICEVCGGVEPCSHNFDKIEWPKPADEPAPQVSDLE